MYICPKCGSQIKEDNKGNFICHECGYTRHITELNCLVEKYKDSLNAKFTESSIHFGLEEEFGHCLQGKGLVEFYTHKLGIEEKVKVEDDKRDYSTELYSMCLYMEPSNNTYTFMADIFDKAYKDDGSLESAKNFGYEVLENKFKSDLEFFSVLDNALEKAANGKVKEAIKIFEEYGELSYEEDWDNSDEMLAVFL